MAGPNDSGEFPFPGYASLATVERYHTEYKMVHTSLRQDIAALQLKSSELTFTLKAIEERLNTGANTFMRHDDRLSKVEEMKRPQWKTVLALAMIVAPWVWVASRYPDAEKFEQLQQQVQSMQTQQVVMTKQQDSMDRKLDKVLDAKP